MLQLHAALRWLAALSVLLWAVRPTRAEPGAERVPTCLACHGESGQSASAEVPSLGGQPSPYLLVQLVMFREKMRVVATMNDVVKGLADDDLRGLADALAKLPPPVTVPDGADPQRMERAKALVVQMKCNVCHQPDLRGLDSVPRLAGQREDYLVKTLREYKSGARPGYDPAMLDVVAGVSDEQIQDLAYYLARVK